MEVKQTQIPGIVIIEPRLFKDDRGYFFESFSERDFNTQVREIHFVQDNESKSSYGVRHHFSHNNGSRSHTGCHHNIKRLPFLLPGDCGRGMDWNHSS